MNMSHEYEKVYNKLKTRFQDIYMDGEVIVIQFYKSIAESEMMYILQNKGKLHVTITTNQISIIQVILSNQPRKIYIE